MLFDGVGGWGGLQFCKDTELNSHLLPLKIKFWRRGHRTQFPAFRMTKNFGSKNKGALPPPPPFLCHCMFVVHFSHAQCDLVQDYEQILMSNYKATSSVTVSQARLFLLPFSSY